MPSAASLRMKRLDLLRMYTGKTVAWCAENLGCSRQEVGRLCMDYGIQLADFDPFDPRQRAAAEKKLRRPARG